MFLPDNTEYIPVKQPNMACKKTANHRISMEERLNTYAEIDQTYTEEEALTEASRCLHCPTHWCQNACPAGVPAADFIEKIREKDYEGAYALISEQSSLSDMCSRLCPQEKQCQSNCTRGICSESVAIGKLERFVSDWHRKNMTEVSETASNGKTVAVIGSGPSGLAAAQKLRKYGYEVTVFEREEKAGGLLYYGIPNMKLEKTVLEEKIAAIEKTGVKFVLNTKVDAGLSKKIEENFDAAVLAVGSETCRMPVIENADEAKGIVFAVEYLSDQVKNNSELISAKDKNVVIVGGGDTGNDCVGMAVRNGCKSVTQIEMLPKYHKKDIMIFPYAQKKGEQKFDCSQEECLNRFRHDPHRYGSVVTAVETDEDGRIKSAVIKNLEKGTLTEIPCELMVIAAGFTGIKQEIKDAFEIETINGYRTNNERIFCCGDCRTGQSLVVKAMVDGQKCADAVHEQLKGE
ncbi:MAG: FAD-dependent oxidoreductase [Coprococcus sp.]